MSNTTYISKPELADAINDWLTTSNPAAWSLIEAAGTGAITVVDATEAARRDANNELRIVCKVIDHNTISLANIVRSIRTAFAA